MKDIMSALDKEIVSALEKMFGGIRDFNPFVIVDPENKYVEIVLEDVSYHAEWIKGEGADIAIYHALSPDNRVVGAFLPLRVWKGKFPVEILKKDK